jgi:hypothetical protein
MLLLASEAAARSLALSPTCRLYQFAHSLPATRAAKQVDPGQHIVFRMNLKKN